MTGELKPDLQDLERDASSLLTSKSFSYESCEEFLTRRAAVQGTLSFSQRQVLESGKGQGYSVYGLISHGNMSGITKKTFQLPKTCMYLNHFNKFQLSGARASWTSFTFSVNQPVRVHLDANNCPSSSNFTGSFGQYTGGQLWCELSETDNSSTGAIRWRSRPNGQRVAGRFHDTRHRFLEFNPKLFHATDRWTGFRVSLTFYTSRLISQATSTRKDCLKKYGFPVPRSLSTVSDFCVDEAHVVEDVHSAADEISVLLTQDERSRLQDSCQGVWNEVDQLINFHGRVETPVQVMEFGGVLFVFFWSSKAVVGSRRVCHKGTTSVREVDAVDPYNNFVSLNLS